MKGVSHQSELSKAEHCGVSEVCGASEPTNECSERPSGQLKTQLYLTRNASLLHSATLRYSPIHSLGRILTFLTPS